MTRLICRVFGHRWDILKEFRDDDGNTLTVCLRCRMMMVNIKDIEKFRRKNV